ncbi:MAG: outer membrane protein assembly factor BamD [Nevskiales bacterium]|nr:outer membrane protein assembly factor BamD [Nevskiales bacterium]
MIAPLRAALTALPVLLITACSTAPVEPPPLPSERERQLEVEELYKLARVCLDAGDYTDALEHYDRILSDFAFTDFATQAQLESVYAAYRSYEPDRALSSADRFLKEHPRHPAVDYVYYLRGLINAQRGESPFGWLLDTAQQDVGAARRAFDDFALLVQRYPDSRFAGDARQRMVHLRNHIALHELSIVHYYVRRGAHLAAAKRAEKILADYPGAPATVEALALLEDSYRALGLNDHADDVRRVREANRVPAAQNP